MFCFFVVLTKLTYSPSRFASMFIFFDEKSNQMDYYCEVCDKYIKPKSKYKHFKSNSHKEFDKHQHIFLTKEIPNINEVDEIFYAYIIEHNRKNGYYLMKCEFILVFNDNQ